MDKKTGIIVGVLVAALAILVGVSLAQGQSKSYNYSAFNQNQINPASEETGWFEEMIEGDKDAPVIVFEYGNYQCTACAPRNPYVNELVEDYKGKVAVVFRAMDLSDHSNGTASAAAALAAAKQGYWKEYKDLLYKNQADWFYAKGEERQKIFEGYLMVVSKEQANLEQFREDMASQEVKTKMKYDNAMANKAEAEWTPYFVIDGEVIPPTGDMMEALREKIDAKLKTL